MISTIKQIFRDAVACVSTAVSPRMLASGQSLQAMPAEPEVFDHFVDQHVLGGGVGLVLHAHGEEEAFEFFFVFGGQDLEGAAEAVAEIVEAGGGFSRVGTGPRGVEGVGAIGFDLGFGRGHV